MSIVWDGKWSEEYGVGVTKPSSLSRPSRKMEVFSVPGRNGDIVLQQDAWNNYEQEYQIFSGSGKPGGSAIGYDGVAEWLYTPKGYRRLEDVFEPDIYRLAYYKGPFDVENYLNKTGRAKLVFVCRPERFLRFGENKMTVQSGTKLENPTGMIAKPIIEVTGQGAIQIGEKRMVLSGVDQAAVVTIDTENMLVYTGTVNLSAKAAGEFPLLGPGENMITFSGFSKVEMIPRWWRL